MAEEAPAVQNWRLLVVAIVLGLIVAIVYNIHIGEVRKEVRGEQVMLLCVNRDIRPGDRLKAEDISRVERPKTLVTYLGDPLTATDYEYALGKVVNTNVMKDHILTFAHILTTSEKERPSIGLTPGLVGFSLQVDPHLVPGRLLRVGDHVNIMGTFTISGKTSNFTIMESARVLTIAGEIGKPERGSRGEDGMPSFQSISIEVSPTVAKELSNVLSHAGSVRVLVRPATEDFSAIDKNGPQLSPEVRKLAETAAGGGSVEVK
jgi:Flp pilus assembly protein CpaB